MKRTFLISFYSLFISSIAFAQQEFNEHIELIWSSNPISRSVNGVSLVKAPYFTGATYRESQPGLPVWQKTYKLNTWSDLDIEIQNAVYAPLANLSEYKLPASFNTIESSCAIAGTQVIGYVGIVPLRKNQSTGLIEQLISADLKIRTRAAAAPASQQVFRSVPNSVLMDGDIYKVKISKAGVYKLDYNFLKSLNIDVDHIDPRNIQIYCNQGGNLPDKNNDPRPDDLTQLAVLAVGEADGKFDQNDYICFYAEGADHWYYDNTKSIWRMNHNYYSDDNYAFIKIGSVAGKRISAANAVGTPVYTTTSYDAIAHHEADKYNLLDEDVQYPPSGRVWYGELMKNQNYVDISFSFPHLITSADITTYTAVAGKCVGAANAPISFSIGSSTDNTTCNCVSGTLYSIIANRTERKSTLRAGADNFNFKVTYTQPNSDASAWLDYATVNARCNLDFSGQGGQMTFRDDNTILPANLNSVAGYSIANASNLSVWDITDLTDIRQASLSLAGSTASFSAATDVLRTFVAFDGSSFLTPTGIGKITNQNLHAMNPPNLIIVYHPDFETDATRLAQYRRNKNGYSVELVSVNQIYNEFASGRPEPGAIRDFAKLVFDKSTNGAFKYLLLFGDASFDYKNDKIAAANNENFVPTYETPESLDPIYSYPSDDFFGLLTSGEGGDVNQGALDIGVGRFAVTTAGEAKDAVDKLIQYETAPQSFNDFKNRITFLADDGEGGSFVNDDQVLAQLVANQYKQLNVSKVYLDAYPLIHTSAGDRFPDAQQALLSDLFKGTFMVNYSGHGGYNGLTQERVFTNTEIVQLANKYKLPHFITATCEFGPFDDPQIKKSSAELLFLSTEGGAASLFSTTRPIYEDLALMQLAMTSLFDMQPGGTRTTLGEALSHVKNNTGANARKLSLFGDPSAPLPMPVNNVVTTAINGRLTGADTIRSLQHVTITGYIQQPNGSPMTSFNGTIYPTVFDKKKTLRTLGNVAASPVIPFDVQETVIFKGKASVVNGQFSFSFVVPKDINYDFGRGKISYYAENGQSVDASGYYEDIFIGGTSANASADTKGPDVKVYMNDDKFAFGGMTNANPVIFVKLFDENGINTTGASIGHDISGDLDKSMQTHQSYTLNDFYEATVNDYKSGTVRYPLYNLADGVHTIKVKAWDVYNNSGEGNTEFVVASNAGLALKQVLNYPNPFTTHTDFQFEHTLPNQPLDVNIQIFTVSGRLVKTLNQRVTSEGYAVRNQIFWDGRDEFGDEIGRGVYVYKVSVRAPQTSGASLETSAFEKLVILK